MKSRNILVLVVLTAIIGTSVFLYASLTERPMPTSPPVATPQPTPSLTPPPRPNITSTPITMPAPPPPSPLNVTREEALEIVYNKYPELRYPYYKVRGVELRFWSRNGSIYHVDPVTLQLDKRIGEKRNKRAEDLYFWQVHLSNFDPNRPPPPGKIQAIIEDWVFWINADDGHVMQKIQVW